MAWSSDGALLPPGDYELKLVPRRAGSAQPAIRDTLRVARS
jgi:hypothetical protein